MIRGHLLKEKVSGIENTREDIIDDRLCSVKKKVRHFVTWVTYTTLFKKTSRCRPPPPAPGLSGFKWDPRDKQG